ncbi:MAG: site-specific integrase, partial [Proteobacteria bacterium]|nr:site-specific integrase [Pseudomonadota bacterium]
MAIEHVLQEKFVDLQPFNPPESPDQETDALTPRKNPLIEKWLGQLAEKGLFGRPYVKDYLYGLKRRNCRPSTIRSYGSTLLLFLSYLKERGRVSLETTTREDLSSFIE